MKNLLYNGILILGLIGIYFYNNPLADFKSDKPKGIQFFRGDWNEALQMAKKEHKILFLDIYATWCGPCKKLKSRTFSNKEVGDFYNQHFINVSLDGEKGQGPLLSNEFNLRSYPSLFYIDENGKLVQLISGYQDSNDLINIGKSVIAELNKKQP